MGHRQGQDGGGDARPAGGNNGAFAVNADLGEAGAQFVLGQQGLIGGHHVGNRQIGGAWDMASPNAWARLGDGGVEAGCGAGIHHEFGFRAEIVAHVANAAQASIAALGRVDILVNNAGIAGPTVKTWEYTAADFRRVIDIDLMSVYYCCHALVQHMAGHGWGRVVNIASIAGKEGNPNASAYSAAKAGVIGLTKSLGKELATSGVLVNCITPAAAKTDIFKQISQAHIDFMLSKIPMGRFVEVEEIAAMAAWLSSPDCSFTTGGVFDISGGRATY